MRTSFESNTLILLGIFTIMLVSPVSAEWQINVLDQPYSFENVSNSSDTVQMIELTDGNSNAINESQLAGDSFVRYKYNGTTSSMEWLTEGYWYTEDLELNNTGGTIEFEAQGETSSSLIGDSVDETNATREFNLGNLSIELINEFDEPIDPQRNFDIQVNVTDMENNMFEDEADVDFYFTNGSWTSEIYNIKNIDDLNNDGQDDHYKNFGLNFDLEYYSTYILHVNATNTTNVGYQNPFGVQSMRVETLPEIIGEIQTLNASSGCDSQSFFAACERGAVIDTEFNITSSTAQNVNLSLELRNSSSGMWEENQTVELDRDNDLFTGQVTVPDINTSAYDTVFKLKYNATDGGREEIVDRVINYRDYKIVDKSDSVTAKGPYNVRLEIRKFFTPQLLENSRIVNGTVNIIQPSGDTLTSFDVEDMERRESSGHFQREIGIPVDAENGIYEMSVEVENIYNRTKVEMFNFNVTEVQQTFILNEDEDLEETISKTGENHFNITLENRMASETNISTEVTGDIDNFTEVNNGDNISLEAEETRNVSVVFDIGYVDDYEGEIEFMDTNAVYNRTMDIELDSNPCSYRENTVCVLAAGINSSSDERGEIIKDFTVTNYGQMDENYSFSYELSGNITEQAALGNNGTELNTVNDSEEVNITYSVTSPGFYQGLVTVSNEEDEVEIPVSLNSTVEPNDVSIALADTVELDAVEEGGSVTKDMDIENTGDVEIASVEISSQDYSVSADSTSIAPGSTETVTVQFSDISSESGEVIVTAETESDTVTETVDVTATIVPDYRQQADDYERRLIDLDSQVSSDSEYQSQLNNAQSSISELRSAYRQGNYEEAEQINNQVQNTLDTVEMEIASQPAPNNPDDEPQTGQTNDGGGFPILPLAIAIFVILLIGFVAYTSIEFEEGDPLYDVLEK